MDIVYVFIFKWNFSKKASLKFTFQLIRKINVTGPVIIWTKTSHKFAIAKYNLRDQR